MPGPVAGLQRPGAGGQGGSRPGQATRAPSGRGQGMPGRRALLAAACFAIRSMPRSPGRQRSLDRGDGRSGRLLGVGLGYTVFTSMIYLGHNLHCIGPKYSQNKGHYINIASTLIVSWGPLKLGGPVRSQGPHGPKNEPDTFFNYDSHYEFPECLNVSRWPGDIRASPVVHPHHLGDNIRGSHSFSAPSALSSKKGA